MRPIIDLASNINPYGPSSVATARLRALDSARYPEKFGESLRAQLATLHGVSESQVVCAAGASALIEMLFRTLRDDKAAMWSDPSFILYEMCARQIGRAYRTVPHLGWFVDLNAMADALSRDIALVLIANPNNPTGTFLLPQQIEAFLDRIPTDVVVAVDEAYIDYGSWSCVPLLARHENLVIIRTFSKAYGLAGLRVGYAIGAAPLIERLRAQFFPFHLPHADTAAAALADTAHLADCVARNSHERERVALQLEALGLSPPPSEANFIFLPLSAAVRRRVAEGAAANRIQIGDLTAYGLPNAIRVSLGTESDNDLFLEVMREAVSLPTAAQASA